ncbi:MAG: tRNA lysidine(34) synthetase TilS [Actinobacteria bacterium]|nr:tRNA lysidine(34) synthetase TilS [Actinomycetota bacterium]NBY14847.1 tRNA lysidine(34) synthetase TilS [Actinomycetota bacterium]
MINLEIRQALKENLSDLSAGDKLVVACSGGADSLALVRAAVHVGRELAINVGAIVIDHQLQSGSALVSSAAAVLAEELGADPVELIAVEVVLGPGSGGLEAAARDARRSAFESYAAENGVKAILLGHTREDQAETVLLGLARGSGARSLSGMRAIEGLYRRPFLRLARELVRNTVSDLDVHEDPHNSDHTFARVRVRESILPLMETELGPGVAAALARTADMLRDDADALDEIAAKHGMIDEVEVLAKLPRAMRTRIIRKLAMSAGCTMNDLTREHVLNVDALIVHWHGQGPLNLPGLINVERTHGKLRFYHANEV